MILVVDMNWKKESLAYYEFVLPIIEAVKTLDTTEVKHYSEVADRDVNRSDCIILSGTTLEDNTTLEQPDRFQWLKKTEKPVLGICAGMQTIGVAFGLKLVRCLEIGLTPMRTTKNNALMQGEFKAYSLHNFSVEPSGDFEALAESDACIQAIRHKQKPLFGVLFHPEVRNEDLLKRFVQLKS